VLGGYVRTLMRCSSRMMLTASSPRTWARCTVAATWASVASERGARRSGAGSGGTSRKACEAVRYAVRLRRARAESWPRVRRRNGGRRPCRRTAARGPGAHRGPRRRRRARRWRASAGSAPTGAPRGRRRGPRAPPSRWRRPVARGTRRRWRGAWLALARACRRQRSRARPPSRHSRGRDHST
jgi:hypothetical protein